MISRSFSNNSPSIDVFRESFLRKTPTFFHKTRTFWEKSPTSLKSLCFFGCCALLFLMVSSVVLKVILGHLSAFLVGLCASNLKECYSVSCIFQSISCLWIDVWRLWKQKVITSSYARARKDFSVRFCCRITSVNGCSFDVHFAYSKKKLVVSSLLHDVGFKMLCHKWAFSAWWYWGSV